MDVNQRQDLAQQQTLHLTPELRQGLAVLQLNAVDLAEFLASSIEANPVFADVSYAPAWESAPGVSAARADETLSDAPAEKVAYSTADANRTVYTGEAARSGRVSTEALMEGRGHGSPETFDFERRDMSQRSFSFDRYLEVPETVTEHVMGQMRLATDDQTTLAIAGYLAGNLDESGYLEVSVGQAAEALGVREQVVEAVLAQVQRFDPVGIAARDLAECLRLQLEASGRMSPTIDCLLNGHLDDLATRSLASVAKGMGVPTADLEEALAAIRSCNPRPGLQFGRPSAAVWPEILVSRMPDGRYAVRLQDMRLPALQIDEQYRTMARTVRDRETAQYLKEKIREAEGLIEGVAYRNATLYKVACCVVELQREFLDEGFNRLRPMTMAQVADLAGVSTSTVSRIAGGNYLQTPRGTFELRFFFHGAAQAEGDVEVSSISVKRRIREIVEAEDASKPLSDQAIADILHDDGVDVSRRTVAKYRGQLGIPVRAARKRS